MIYNTPKWKPSKYLSTDEWGKCGINKGEYYSAFTTKENLPKSNSETESSMWLQGLGEKGDGELVFNTVSLEENKTLKVDGVDDIYTMM